MTHWLMIEDVAANTMLFVAMGGWGFTLWVCSRYDAIIKELAPFAEIKKLQDGQDKFLAGLKPEEQVKFIQAGKDDHEEI